MDREKKSRGEEMEKRREAAAERGRQRLAPRRGGSGPAGAASSRPSAAPARARGPMAAGRRGLQPGSALRNPTCLRCG